MPDTEIRHSAKVGRANKRGVCLLFPVNRDAGEFRDCWKDSLERSSVVAERVKAEGSLRGNERERERESAAFATNCASEELFHVLMNFCAVSLNADRRIDVRVHC